MVEDTPPDTFVVGLIVNGVSLPAESTYSFTWDPTKAEPVIVFQNFEDTGSEN